MELEQQCFGNESDDAPAVLNVLRESHAHVDEEVDNAGEAEQRVHCRVLGVADEFEGAVFHASDQFARDAQAHEEDLQAAFDGELAAVARRAQEGRARLVALAALSLQDPVVTVEGRKRPPNRHDDEENARKEMAHESAHFDQMELKKKL